MVDTKQAPVGVPCGAKFLREFIFADWAFFSCFAETNFCDQVI